jgi:hypothetical protein
MAVQRQSAVQRYLSAATVAEGDAEAIDEGLLERKSYCILRGRREMLTTLRLINLQGRVRSFDYSGFTGVNLDSPDALVLHYESRELFTVTIRGRLLDGELLEGLEWKRVLWIRELDELVAAGVRKHEAQEPLVTAIRIAKGSVSREW